MLPNTTSLPKFICECTPVSEILEFNQKKKEMNNSENDNFLLGTFPIVQTEPLFSFDGIVTIM